MHAAEELKLKTLYPEGDVDMAGKGSKRRPSEVTQTEWDKRWDLIFGGKNMKHQHNRGIITEEISTYLSADGRRESIVVSTEKGYMVELYENKKYIKTVDVTDHSLSYAEDAAENWTLDIY